MKPEKETYEQMRNMQRQLDELDKNVSDLKDCLKIMFPEAYQKYLDAKEKKNENKYERSKEQTP